MKRNSLLSLLAEFIVLPVCYIVTAILLLLALLIFLYNTAPLKEVVPVPPVGTNSGKGTKDTGSKPSGQPNDKKKTPPTPSSPADHENGSGEKEETIQPDTGAEKTPVPSDTELAPEQNIKEESPLQDDPDEAGEAVTLTSPGVTDSPVAGEEQVDAEEPSSAEKEEAVPSIDTEPEDSAEEQAERQTKPPTRGSCGKPWTTPLMEMTGEIRKAEYRTPPGTGLSGLHLDVETDGKQSVVIHVFPEQLTKQCSELFDFKAGETVTVSGSAFFTGRAKGQKNLCAADITRNSETLKLRNPVTGDLEKDACCQKICSRNCAGKPPMCGNMCMTRCTSGNHF